MVYHCCKTGNEWPSEGTGQMSPYHDQPQNARAQVLKKHFLNEKVLRIKKSLQSFALTDGMTIDWRQWDGWWKLMVHLVNMFVEELRVQKTMNVIKTHFLKPIIGTKFKNEYRKAWNNFGVVGNVVFQDFVNQKEREVCEHYPN